MSQKGKLNTKEKVEIIKKYRQGEISLVQAARDAGVGTTTIYRWSARYETEGAAGLFWGILKRERYYGKRFTSKQELVQMIECYIRYYNTRRVQRNLGVLTPIEKHKLCLAA